MLTVIPISGYLSGFSSICLCAFNKRFCLPALGVLGIFLTVQFLESNFITPKIVGSKVSVNPFVAIVALLIEQRYGNTGNVIEYTLTAILKLLLDLRHKPKPLATF